MNKDKSTEKDLQKIVSFFEDHQDVMYQVFELMPIGICVTNEQGIYTDVNATYCDIYGYTREELIGKNFTIVVPDDHQSHLVELHQKFLQERFELKGRWLVKDKKDNLFEIITNAAYLDDGEDDGKCKMTLVVKADQTDVTLKRLSITLDILEKVITDDLSLEKKAEKESMSGKVSSLLTFADLLKETDLTLKQEQWLKIIMDIGKDTLRHLSSADDFEAMETGSFKPQLSNFDFINLICNQIMDSAEMADEKGIRINIKNQDQDLIDPYGHQLIVVGDEFYLEYLFEHLIKNAITSAPQNSTINITIFEERQLSVYIETESVISEKMKLRFFDKNAHFGKGLENGLTNHLSKLITNVHKGNISFISENDHGTRITVEMPILTEVS
ncbi:hypothetical protein BST97_00795 [Nonlabens spongiae]|uniref:Histidine kinase n=1 Tax=Nonlabens spongiae TaxID=331648 RepID=A0A1W6MGE6_9FLAO|nr:PAS domain-containing sensor histidine kinase [Nonlabens spongiae]ARN76657.1 hypothetical protein BST97_00795 [Nonlabens spongiae]